MGPQFVGTIKLQLYIPRQYGLDGRLTRLIREYIMDVMECYIRLIWYVKLCLISIGPQHSIKYEYSTRYYVTILCDVYLACIVFNSPSCAN